MTNFAHSGVFSYLARLLKGIGPNNQVMDKSAGVMTQKVILLLISLLGSLTLNSQNLFPEKGFLYDDDQVARIDITIAQEDLDFILTPGNEESDFEFPATFRITRGTETNTEENIGFRLRGNTSRYSAKKSFKVSLNSFTAGRKFQGVEKINLNGEHNDPSIMRAKISWDLFRAMGVPAPRANHVELYINNEYKGLYLNVEHIDEEFVDLRFGNNDGNLYKCLWPADLVYLGDNPDLYKYTNNNRRAYELKRNEELDDYSDLAYFIEVLNNTDPADFPQKLEPVFNVNSYLKNLVVEVLTGHWDAYAYNKNNFYLYKNEDTDKFEFIPYDPDNTFGIDWMGIDWATRDIYSWAHPSENRPLTKSILQNEIYRDRYSFYTNQFLTEYFNKEYLEPRITSLREKIAPFTTDDIYRTYDYGYDYDAFYNSVYEAAGAHVKTGIIPFIELRNQASVEQLDAVDISPVISRIQTNKPIVNEDIIITALVEDEEMPKNVRIWYSGGGAFSQMDMQATGNGIYRAIIPAISWEGSIQFYIEAEDVSSQITREPYAGEYRLNITTSVPESGFARINELNVFPNPFHSYFNISYSGDFNEIHYRIYDMSGKLYIEGQTQSEFTKIQTDFTESTGGVFILQLDVMDDRGIIISTEYQKMVFLK